MKSAEKILRLHMELSKQLETKWSKGDHEDCSLRVTKSLVQAGIMIIQVVVGMAVGIDDDDEQLQLH